MVDVPFPDLCNEGESATDHQKGLVASIQDTYFGNIDDSYENSEYLKSSVNKDEESLNRCLEISEVCSEYFSSEVWPLFTNNCLPGIPPLITLPKKMSSGRFEIRFRIPVKGGVCSLLSAVMTRLLGDNVEDYIQLLGKIATVIADLHSHNLVLGDFCADTIYIEKFTTPTELLIKVWIVSLANIHVLQPSAHKEIQHIQSSPPQQREARRRAAPEVVKMGLYSRSSDVFCFARLMWWVFNTLSEDRASQIVDSSPSDPLKTISDSEIYETISSVNAPSLLKRPRVCPTDTYSLMEQCWRPRRSERPSMSVLQEHLTKKEGLSFLENYEAQNDNFMKYPTTLVFPKEEYDESTSIGSASTSFSGSSSLSSSRKNSATCNTEQLLSIPQTALENPSSTFFGEAAMLSSSPSLPSLRPSQVRFPVT
ncbi:receptor-interacting serine/threonine-protein kinase 1-like [Pomacea canaliculata]|uniref:receptor-interacting serine/threonine-protein kinase 1-like n=1 Tax=Pomacea canaliculata TaxID=400727 RepID=UPI000D72D178|nr:receptor-interacting serine/threonine-protein kinase 1-like [Pomacea canaliculata]